MTGEGATRDLAGGVSEAEEPALCPCGRGYVGHLGPDATDPEQCHADPDCEARAWLNLFCGPHQPEKGVYR